MSYEGKLRSISVKKNKATVKYTDNPNVDGVGIVPKTKTEEVDHPISDRFANILRSFLGHGLVRLGLLCGNLNEKAMKSRKCIDMPEFKNFNVSSLAISGDGENEAIKIGLTWETPEGEIVPVNVPAIKTNNGGYVYEDLINDDISNVIIEANLYIEDKNYAAQGQQMNMFAGGEDEEQF